MNTTTMTYKQFRARWDKDERGDGITFDEIAKCYVAWGLGTSPKTKTLEAVRYAVLKAARVSGLEDYEISVED